MQSSTDASSFLRRLAQVIYPLCTAADTKKFTDDLSTASNGCTKNTTYDWAGIDDPTQPQRAELCACNVSAITVPKCMWTKYSKEEKQPFNVTTVEHFTFVYNCFTISGKSLPSVTVEGAAAAETPVPTNATTTNYCTDEQISAFTSALNTASDGCMGGTSYDWGGDENPTETQYKEICKCTSVSAFTIPDCSVKKGDDTNTLTTHYKWVTDTQCKSYPVEKSSNVGLIAGIAGGVVVIVLLIIGFLLCKRRRKSKQHQEQHELYQDTNAALSPVGYRPIGVTPRTTGPKKYTDSRPSDGGRTTISTTNGSVRPSGSGSMGLKDGRRMTETATWDDPVITAVRIPLDAITFDTLISRGGYGEVYRGTYRGETVAIKQLLPARRKDLAQINDFLGEVKLMSSLDHERVVKFIGVAWNSLSDACMVIEYMENGDLRSVLTRWDEGKEKRKNGFDDDKVKIALHIAHALVYLHSLQSVVLHRDFKSKNILLDANMDAKLTDFGISRERADVTMTAGVGSSLWMAPEVMMGNRYDEKADIFSFGVVLSELDTHQLPYFHARVSEFGQNVPDTAILQQVMLGRISVAFSDRADPELVDLGRECVRLNPDERPTTAMVLHRVHQVAHGWHRGMAF